MIRRTSFRPSTLWVTVTLALGCGPGLEQMHESTLRFEHCYRLDMDTRIAPPHREHCWRDWTETYSAGQSLDRVEYARRRLSQLESGDTAVVAIGVNARPERRVFEELASPNPQSPMAAPAPTNVHEPPPKTAPAPGDTAKAVSPSVRPGQKCTESCDTTLDDCNRLCAGKHLDCTGCAPDYRACMRRCFE